MKVYAFKLVNGFNHFKQSNLFRVVGINNEYVGEWSENISDIETELKELKN